MSKINRKESKTQDNTLKLTVGIPPSINNDYMKPRGIWGKNGKPMAMMYETGLAKKYKNKVVRLVKKEVLAQKFLRDDSKFVAVYYTFFFPRTNMDTNNYYKCLVDAFTNSKIIWDDDNVSLMRDRRIYYDSKNPRLEVEIIHEDYIGIFDNEKDLQVFIGMNCGRCTRGRKIGKKGGCSIYKKALESRIQDDLHINFCTGEKTCLKFKVKQ